MAIANLVSAFARALAMIIIAAPAIGIVIEMVVVASVGATILSVFLPLRLTLLVDCYC